MVESEAKELPESVMLGAVMFGHRGMQPVIDAIIRLAEKAAKDPWDLNTTDNSAMKAEIKKLVGYVPGEPSLDPNLTGGQILEYFAHLRGGVHPDYFRKPAARPDPDTSRRFRQYSSGNKRKVVLIQAFMHRPRLLILDEPTNGLDPINQQEFDTLVREARGEGRTVLLSSHVLSEVEKTCTRVGIIREGKLVRVGGLAELKDIKRYEVTIAFADPVPANAFANVPGVIEVESLNNGHAMRIAMQGAADAVVKQAARYNVLSLTSYEPSLEDVFMRYYEKEASRV